MSRDLFVRRLLRGIAIAIGIGAAIDPAITTDRSGRPDVAVIAADAVRDSVLAQRVTRSLGASFTVTAAPFTAAAATVLVGTSLPASRAEMTAPVFAVIPDHAGATATVAALQVPAWAPLNARVPVGVTIEASGASSRDVVVTLRQNGVVVDQARSKVTSNDQRSSLSLSFTPTAVGVSVLQVVASFPGQADSSVADAIVDIRDRRWSVLFYEPRPSWLATFVRRAAERDQRLTITSRTLTSRNISTASGKAPATLDDDVTLNSYHAIVVGAPDALTERDVAGLESFLRNRGGSVILLLDQRTDGPWQRLANAGAWLDNGSGRMVSVGSHPGAADLLKASELAWPAHLPPGAEALAVSLPTAGDSAPSRPVIWRSAVGGGDLIVSGALDAWRFRDSTISGFDRFWRNQVAAAAGNAMPPLTIALASALAVPGETVGLSVTVRDAMFHPLPAHVSVSAAIESIGGQEHQPIRLWPSGPVGQLSGTIRAPVRPGTYHITASTNGSQAEAPLVVAPAPMRAAGDGSAIVAAWVAAHGGSTVAAAQLGQLPAAIRAAAHALPRRERWHPLRSPWWLLPFALALSGEWWLRRRRGLP